MSTIDTTLALRLLESARSVLPLVEVRAASLEDELRARNGEPVRAQVAARLADGTFRVLIDGKAFKLALPPEVKTGDVLQLRVLPREAQPPLPPAGAPAQRPETLSSGAQFLARVLAQPAREPPRQSTPVLDVPPSRPEEMPEPLARAVERSGVFYESHQARWLEGEFPLQRLLEEPQALLNRQPAAVKPEAPLAALKPDALAQPSLPVSPQPVDAAVETIEPLLAQPAASAVIATDSGERVQSMSSEAAYEAMPIVRQQLDALDTRQLTWLGDVWPGQPMRWQIAEEPDSHSEEVESRAWHSRFSLTLPALGEVAADLTLQGARIGLRLAARDPASATLMRSACADLVQALQSAGLGIDRCEVFCDERGS